MAKVKDPLHSLQASGSVGGITFQAWKGIDTVREKPVPTKTSSTRQLVVRGIMSLLSKYWANTLTEGLRQAWKNFADNFVWTDIFGKVFSMSGINIFTKINFPLQDHSRPLQTTTPPPQPPSEIGDIGITNTDGEVAFQIPKNTEGEINSQMTFLDIWCAGDFTFFSVDVQADYIGIQIRGVGLPQGVNPVKSDYKHIDYQSEGTVDPPPGVKQIEILMVDPTGNEFENPRRVAVIVRRYNRYGLYSTGQKVSLVSTVTPP